MVMARHSQNKVGAVSMMQVGWIYDTVKATFLIVIVSCVVMSLPWQKVIKSVVEQCGSEWYRLGIGLGYNDGQIQSMTFNIPTPEGKLRVIIERKSKKHGKRKAIEALLDACDQTIPLAVVAVMEDLGIEYIDNAGVDKLLLFVIFHVVQCVLCSVVSDQSLFKLGNEVGSDWKELAIGLGMTSRDVDNIEMEAHTPRDQAWKMLRVWHAKKRRDFSVDRIRENLQEIRKKEQTKQQQSKCLFSIL